MVLHSSKLNDLSHIRHGFFGRQGGVSQGLYSSLNVGYGSDDNADNITQNRQIIAQQLGIEPQNLLSLYQCHSNKIITITDQTSDDARGLQADAMVTNVPGKALGILTADCIPVLFADHEKPIIGAAHAGWKGLRDGIIPATINAMRKLGASNIIAAIGPCIQQSSYEVSANFADDFPEITPYLTEIDGRTHADLPALARAQLAEIDAENLATDTYSDEKKWFSFRRATHKGEADYGRQMSVITLPPVAP